MTTMTTEAPTRMADEVLDEISGGPHFRHFHGSAFDFQSSCDAVFVQDPGVAEGDGEDFR